MNNVKEGQFKMTISWGTVIFCTVFMGGIGFLLTIMCEFEHWINWLSILFICTGFFGAIINSNFKGICPHCEKEVKINNQKTDRSGNIIAFNCPLCGGKINFNK